MSKLLTREVSKSTDGTGWVGVIDEVKFMGHAQCGETGDGCRTVSEDSGEFADRN